MTCCLRGRIYACMHSVTSQALQRKKKPKSKEKICTASNLMATGLQLALVLVLISVKGDAVHDFKVTDPSADTGNH